MPASPAAERNKQPLAEVLGAVLPPSGMVLEIASGTGQHAEHFARTLSGLRWQPSDADVEMLPSLAARVQRAGLPNLEPPLRFDVHDAAPVLGEVAAIVCINMIHIAPWSACEALLRNGVLTKDTHHTVLRFAPPLVITKTQLNDAIGRIERTLAELHHVERPQHRARG